MKNNKEFEEDFLEDDQPIPRQNYVCLSFVSPEKVLEDKHLYYMWHFKRHLQAKIEELNGKLKEAMNSDETGVDVEVTKQEECSFKNFKEMFLDFEYAQHTKIEKEFYELNDFRTTVRGLKIRGTYDTRREADRRAKRLQQMDPSHHVFTGVVGSWMPWDPAADDVEDQEYAIDELNTLMKKKKENEIKKNIHWENEKREKLEAAQRKRMEHEARQREEQQALEDKQADEQLVMGGGASKEDNTTNTNSGSSGSVPTPVNSVAEDVKAGLASDDPWMQRKLLEEAQASTNSSNDAALENTINELQKEQSS